MLDTELDNAILEDCLAELPAFSAWELWSQPKMTEEEPVRPFFDVDAWINYDSEMRGEFIAVVLSTPTDPRKVLIPTGGPEGYQFEKARYILNPHPDLNPRADGKANIQPVSKIKPFGKLLEDMLGDRPNEFEMRLLRGMSDGTYRRGDTLPTPQVA